MNPLMEKYTFIFEYKKGTYIKQVESRNLIDAIRLWSCQLNATDIPDFDDKKQKQLQHEIALEDPIALYGMNNVWCMFLRIGRSSYLLNIVATKA